MRALKSHVLKGVRDNRNQWRIASEDLDAWRLHTVRAQSKPHTPHTKEIVSELRERLSGETARADAAERARDQAEADRDRWQEMAQKLAERPHRKWWTWWRD